MGVAVRVRNPEAIKEYKESIKLEPENALTHFKLASLYSKQNKQKLAIQPRNINRRAKSAMMIAVDKQRKWVPESQVYYEKKRSDTTCWLVHEDGVWCCVFINIMN